jgi:tetratricopeptide (TPR) repeat protein
MPRVPTEISHFAFRHHRIVRHPPREDSSAKPKPSAPGRLVPLDDLSHLTDAERERAFGLAAVQLLTHPSARDHGAAYAEQAERHLERALAAGADDAEVHAALARLLWQVDPSRARAHAERVLQFDEASAEARGAALYTLARTSAQHDLVSAIPYWEQLVALRRYGDAWHALGRAYALQGRTADAVAALEKAVSISPARPDFRRTLAAVLSAAGDAAGANRCVESAEGLEQPR